ncbi:FkbM family methyltransferase [uncultured Algimonas sp.]|uniref:FkbM family methyltransferase n=1 Tax=uncultured Algimonas sp. TaxID=1547920 RepID=UPI0026105EB1|nr:FkbM family methyltransferase [uncultured Algimonas sp.]
MGTTTHDQPFGHSALPPTRERIRLRAGACADTRLGRWLISARRKRAIRGLSEPFDVVVAPNVKARLYPSGNRCEKRALAGVQIWDAAERGALREAIGTGADPFVFLDIGANAGLYSLFVNAYARAASRAVRLIAVEPSATMAGRLAFNAKASRAEIELVRSAVSDAPGQAHLSDGGGNRGEAQLGGTGEIVLVETLYGLCDRLGVTRIDAMKVDIEGHDKRALRAFFRDAPETLHPRLLILELSAESRSPLVELACAQNYLLSDDTAMNAVFKKKIDHVQT